jgi:hypothetical protein
MSKKSPMSLSLDYLNKLGYTCEIVERWIPGANIRKDAFGFADILAYHRCKGHVALVQTTSWSNFSARRNKILASPHRNGWKASFGKIFLHAWGPKGLREAEL